MWAVIRYSTGKRVAYFTSEVDAEAYVKDQNRYDEELAIKSACNGGPPYRDWRPDWGWMLVPMTAALEELLSGN